MNTVAKTVGPVKQVHSVSNGWGGRRRFALAVGLLLAAIIPASMLIMLGLNIGDFDLIVKTILLNSIAISFGMYFIFSMESFPGNQSTLFVLPAFLISFSITLALMIFLRIDYSRILLFSAIIIIVIWMYIITIFSGTKDLRVGIVPFGGIDLLTEIPRVQWVSVVKPDLEVLAEIDAIVVDLRADLPDVWERFLADVTLAGTAVFHVKQIEESLTGRVRIDHMSENSFGSLVPLKSYLVLKRLTDVLTAIVALIVLFPFLVLIGIAIRLDSPGRAIFRQTRMGFRGVTFTMLKFRTMRHDEASESGLRNAITEEADPRITRFGKFMRRTRIDELPQIINILRGEMSWIGPRPEAEVLSEWYEREIPFYRYRHVIRPGITGWAQVNQGHVAEVGDVMGKLEYDFYYIRHFSIWLDALVVARTILIMISGFGAR